MKLKTLLAAAAVIAPAFAHAHPGHEGDHDFGWDFVGGLAHPVLGWDHLIAMLAVGMWAARLAGKAQWQIPTAFVATLATGAALARTGWSFPAMEGFIAASLIGFGALIALAAKWPTTLALPVVALFAFAHGSAHGAEMPPQSSAGYIVGMVLASSVLHLLGWWTGKALVSRTALARTAGRAIAAAGAWALAS